jgi:hypothetical protein
VCDYFLLGHLKSKAYLTKPRGVYELHKAIKGEFTATPDMVREAMRNLTNRQEQCRRDGGTSGTCPLQKVKYVRVVM